MAKLLHGVVITSGEFTKALTRTKHIFIAVLLPRAIMMAACSESPYLQENR